MNTKASVTIKTPMGDTYPLILSNLAKQETVRGPLLNNCSLDRFSILSIIFEKLLQNRINKLLQQNASKFKNGGMEGKAVVDGLFIR